MRQDVWSGWGVRTPSSGRPSFNAFSDQKGSVWPHDHGIIALGLKRYGFHEDAARIARDISEAASFFALHQLPELCGGIQQDGANFPVQYLDANVPQAWAAGTVFLLIRAFVGFQPCAPEGLLYLDSWLPPWLPDLTLKDLRIGSECFAIRMRGREVEVNIEVIAGEACKIRRRSMNHT